jgi:hypothetical protein
MQPKAPHTVIETPAYLRKATRLMDEDERADVVDTLAEDPRAGALIKGTGGLRKVRMPLQGQGKRGGARVIYWWHSEDYPVALLWAFAKNEADNLTAEQRRLLSQAAEALLQDFGG